MALNPDQRKLRARIAANTRHHGPDHPETAEAHRAYRAAALEEHVHRALAEEPAISAAQEVVPGLVELEVAVPRLKPAVR
jgi:hypothetical protein